MEIQYEVIIRVWRDAASATLQRRNEEGELEILHYVEASDVNSLVPNLSSVLRSQLSTHFEKKGADLATLERKADVMAAEKVTVEPVAEAVAETVEKTWKARVRTTTKA